MNFEQAYQQAIKKYESRTPKSKEAYREACKYIAGGECRSIAYFNPYPFTVKKAEGYTMYDLDDNEYVDFLSNYTSLIHGHANPMLTKAIAEAAALGTAAPAGIEEQVTLAKIICERVPSVDQLRFCNSGTEATMFAIRTARAYKGRMGVIKMLGGYHGTHDVVECSISPILAENQGKKALEPISEPGVSPNTMKDIFIAPYNSLSAVEEILKLHANEIACIIVEPFMGTTGMIPAKPGYLQGLRELADKYDVVYIMDEVQSFRLSVGGAQKKYGVNADLTTFGKIIGGGLAVGAFGGKKEIMSLFHHSCTHALSQSGTFNGNRPTMAGGIASLTMLDQKCINYIDSLGERLEKGFQQEIDIRSFPMSITRDGSLMNIHMSAEKPFDYETAFKCDKAILKLWYLEMLNRGIFPAPRGLFVISTVMTEKVIDETIRVFGESLDAIAPFS